MNAKFFYENIGVIPQNVNFAVKASYLENLIAMLPTGESIMKGKTRVVSGPLENKVEQINPFIVQVRAY